jgi:methyl-accepting chemotaxis protein
MLRNSLIGKLLQLLAALILAAAVVITAASFFQAESTLERVMETHARMLLKGMESATVDRILQMDYVYLRRYVEKLHEDQPIVSYAVVVNAAGQVVAHTDHQREGKAWVEAGGPSAAIQDNPGTRRTRFQGRAGEIFELWLPLSVAGKKVGTIVLGVDMDPSDRAAMKLGLRTGAVVLLTLSFAMLAVWVFSRRFTGGLKTLVEKAEEISGGELRTQVPEEGFDELRSLARAFNAMAENLRAMIRQIQESGGKVGEFSSGITVLIQEQATGASQQATSLAQVTATMEELSRTSHQIAGNAEAVKESAGQTVEMAQQGTSLVRESVEGMGRIKERVNDIAQKTLFLGEKSREIGKVMDLIKEIAGEIHLLALNAAIESAAAGEHGRRFAVVASEVRRLAEKTRESTESIRSLVSEIQSATQGSIQATEQGSREVDKWRETINLTAGAFEEIIGMIEKTSEASMQISLATNQQTSVNDQVVTGMRQVAETVRVSAAHMRDSSISAAELKGLAEKLTEKVSVFRV